MRLECVSHELTAAQREALGNYHREGQRFPVVPGKFYVPLGLSFWRNMAWVEIAENDRTVAPVPLFLFQIVDGTLSARWKLQTGENGSVMIWPPLLYEPAFHDRLSNGDPELIERLASLRTELEVEAHGVS